MMCDGAGWHDERALTFIRIGITASTLVSG